MATFDPYRKWLGIPEDSRPPTHYQLLGISPQEKDAEVINAAVVRQSAYVRNFQSGKYGDDAARILNEIAAAKACLTDAAKRTAYDDELKKKQAARQPPARPAAAAARPAAVQQAARPAAMPMQAPVAVAPRIDPLLEQAALGSAYAPLLPAYQLKKRRSLAPWQLAVAGGLAIAVVVVVGIVVGMMMEDDPATIADAGQPIAPVTDNTASTNSGTAGTSSPGVNSTNNNGGNGSGVVIGATPRTNPSGTSPATSTSTGNTAATTSEDDDDVPPATSTPRPSRAASSGFDWGASQRLSVTAPEYHVPIFSRGYTPFVAVGGEVWNLETGESVGKVKKQTERLERAALSPNGRYFARAQDDFNSNVVEIWDTQEDRRLHNLTFDRDSTEPICMEFTDDEHIIIAWRDSGGAQIQLWNAVEGEGEVWFTTDSFSADDFDVSPDGKYVALATFNDGVLVYDVKKKKIAARLAPPADDNGNRFLSCDGLRFAPDGNEIALVERRGQRLLVWNGMAELVYERTSDTDFQTLDSGLSYRGSAVEWLPNGAGWLLNGHFIFDRESEEVVLIVQSDHDGEARAKFLSEGQLIVTRGSGRTRELISVDVPWQKIRNSLTADSSGRAPVGLELQLSDLRASTPQTATTELTRIITGRLREDGTRVGASEAGVLSATYSETTENRQIPQTDGMGRILRGPGGQALLINTSVTVGRLDLAFTPTGSDEPLWEVNVQADSGGNTGAPGASLFSNLATKLNGTLLPSFIPASEDTLPLPVIADLR